MMFSPASVCLFVCTSIKNFLIFMNLGGKKSLGRGVFGINLDWRMFLSTVREKCFFFHQKS